MVHKKTATALALTAVKNEDQRDFAKLVESFKVGGGGGDMGAQPRLGWVQGFGWRVLSFGWDGCRAGAEPRNADEGWHRCMRGCACHGRGAASPVGPARLARRPPVPLPPPPHLMHAPTPPPHPPRQAMYNDGPRVSWGGGIMGPKSQAAQKKKERALAKDAGLRV